jgi:uncharacterized protein with HEPN domain
MTDPRKSAVHLRDMLEAAEKAASFVGGLTREEFLENDEKVFAVTRALEVIAESVKQVPAHVKHRYPDIPWRAVAGSRDKLVHPYFDVYAEMLWDTVEVDLPPLRLALSRVLEDLESE